MADQVADAEVVTLCQQALEKLGPNGDFRARVLLEMVIIHLAVDAAKAPRLGKPIEPSAE